MDEGSLGLERGRRPILLRTTLSICGEGKDRSVYMMIMDRIALIVSIIGALNWGSIGLFQFDLVSWICGGASTVAARIIYTVVALAGIWCISLLFRSRESYEALEES